MISKQILYKVLHVAAAVVLSWTSMAGRGSATAVPRIDPKEGATFWRWVGAGSCPSELPVDLDLRWDARPLFNSGSPLRCPAMEAFCVFEHKMGQGSVSQGDVQCLDEMDGTYEHTPLALQLDPKPCGGLAVDVEPDIMGLAPAGVLSSLQGLELERSFLKQAGRITLPTDPPPHASEVRLTLFDTSPTGINGLDSESSPHGKTLHLFAQKLLCDPQESPSCVAEIKTRLALSYKSFDQKDRDRSLRDETEGGYFGLIGELAEALVAELHDVGPNDRLVMNLSIAWDRLYGGTTIAANMPPSVKAVYQALECASCQNVVVVAAAGNLNDLHAANNFTEPMMPAAWTGLVNSACPDSPLIYAVGGFDATRTPLANALMMPEFAAYGDHPMLQSSSPTPPLTGSSSSTLVVSATAAAVAFYGPLSMSAADIMATIYNAGELTTQPAGFCASPLNTSCPEISYVSLCESAHSACQGNPSCNLALPPCALRPSTRPDFSNLSMVGLTNSTGNASIASQFPPSSCDPLCMEDLPLHDLGLFPGSPCPRRLYHSLARRPGAHPQPELNLCPSCRVDLNSGIFYAEIESAGKNVQNTILHLVCTGSPQQNYYYAPMLPLQNGDTFTISGLNMTGCTAVTFSYTVHDGNSLPLGSASVPILLATGPP